MISPLKAIRKNCLACNGTAHEVRLCPCEKTCPLWPFRFGHNPNRAGIGGKSAMKNSSNSCPVSAAQNENEE